LRLQLPKHVIKTIEAQVEEPAKRPFSGSAALFAKLDYFRFAVNSRNNGSQPQDGKNDPNAVIALLNLAH